MRTGRPFAVNPRVSVKVALLPDHHKALEILDHDPFTGKRVYGARNHHLDQALSEYFAKHYPDLIRKTEKI